MSNKFSLSVLQLVLVEVFLFTAGWWGATLTLVKLGNDGLHDIFQLFLLSLEGVGICLGVGLEPRDLFVDGLLDLLLFRVAQLGAELVLVSDLKYKESVIVSLSASGGGEVVRVTVSLSRSPEFESTRRQGFIISSSINSSVLYQVPQERSICTVFPISYNTLSCVTRGAAGLNIQSEDKKYSYLWIPYKSTNNIRYFNQETTALPHICISIWPAKAISPS